MATETKANLVKVKSSGQDGYSKGKFDAAMNRKKIESSSKRPIDAKQKSVSTVVTKTEVLISNFFVKLNLLRFVGFY